MYSAELSAIVSALEQERENRVRFGMDTSTLDTILTRAEALTQLDDSTLAGLVDKAHSLVGDQKAELLAQLDALDSLV